MCATLHRLWAGLSYDAIVELRGCNVAQDVRGAQLLTALASRSIWVVRVRAGAVPQYGPKLGWAGTVHGARPGMSGTTTFLGSVASP